MSFPLPQSPVSFLRTSCIAAATMLSVGCGGDIDAPSDSVVLSLQLECPESSVCPPVEGKKLVIRKFLEFTELHPAMEVGWEGLEQLRKSTKPQLDVVLPPGRVGNVLLYPELFAQNGNLCWGGYFDYVTANVVAGARIPLKQPMRSNTDAATLQKCISGSH